MTDTGRSEGRQRLQKFIAASGITSRRKAEELIKAGRISVDGRVVTEMGCKIDPRRQMVALDGMLITVDETSLIYVLLNKPVGYVTTLADPQGRPVVTELLTTIHQRVFPVGRLDLDSEGALLLTNDGALAHKVMHPRYQTTKTYQVMVSGHPGRKRLAQLRQGIVLDNRKTSPASITMVRQTIDHTVFKVIIHEGRKRQIKRMFAAIDHRVIALTRLAYGKLGLGSLGSGAYRILQPSEITKIFL
jgi:23S rRNA pseudouridine2605 synthase